MFKKPLFVFMFCIGSLLSWAQPTITTLAPVQTSFCAGGNIIAQYETTGSFNSGNFFTVELSDLWGNFSNPVVIGTMPFNTGVIPATIPSNTSFGINYRVRVVSSNPNVVGTVSPMPPIIISSTAVTATVFSVPGNTICAGDTVELFSSPNESYVWSNGETTSSILVTQSGSYNVTVVNYLTGCEATSDDIEIVVHPLPPLNFASDTSICLGDTLVLNAGPDNVSYLWNDSLGTTQFYSVSDTGTYYVEVMDTNDCMNFDTLALSINPLPIVDLGTDTSFCGNIYYIDAGPGFDFYNWNNGLSLNQVLQLSDPGIYHVLVTDSNQCSNGDSIEVNIMHVPHLSLGNDLQICGTSLTLDAGAGCENYNWNDSAGLGQYFVVNQSGTYYVYVQDSNNCKVSDTIHVTLNTVPSLYLGSDLYLGESEQFMLDAGPGHSDYLWSTGDISQTLELNSSDIGEGVFSYWVSVMDTNGCFNSDTVHITVDYHMGLLENSKTSYLPCYPNPFSISASIPLPSTAMWNFNPTILFYDLLGRLININYDLSENELRLYASQVPDGMYLFRFQDAEGAQYSGKFIIER